MNTMDTPEIREFIKEATIKLVESYGDILHELPDMRVSSATCCDINISIVTSFMVNILTILEEYFKNKLGDAVHKRKTFMSITQEVERHFKMH